MKSHRTQQGFSFFSLSFYLFLIGFVVFNVLKLFPVYMESFEIESSVRGLEAERGEAYTGAKAVRDALNTKLRFNNVTSLKKENVIIKREDQTYLVNVNYEVRIPYISNIDLVVSFSHHAKVPST